MSDFELVKNTRKFIRKNVTMKYNLRGAFPNLTVAETTRLRLSLESWNSELKVLNSKFLQFKFAEWSTAEQEGRAEEELTSCRDYEDKIFECLSLLNRDPPVSSNSIESARTLLKSPVAPLPTFSGHENEDLERFLREFEDTTNKFSYAEYDKLILLKQQISGRALLLVNSLEADKQGYTHAKELLTKALASTDSQKFSVIKQLTELKLDIKGDPFEYISNMRLLKESSTKLKIDLDYFLQYFIWQGLNSSFKEQLVQITNKTQPSLTEIFDNYFEACNRYQSVVKNFKDKPKNQLKNYESNSTSFAANVRPIKDSGFIPCSLCTTNSSKANHPIYKCDKFKYPKDKIDKLTSLKFCLKCTSPGHTVSQCKFKLKSKCKYCKLWHFSFLCLKKVDKSDSNQNKESQNDSEKESKISSENTSRNTVTITEALQSDVSGDSILPTFTCYVDSLKLRGLKDGGCQSNFITDKLAENLNLKVIKENVNVTINGINASQSY